MNIPRAFFVVTLVASAIFLGNGIVGVWQNTHNIPDVLFLTSIYLGVLALGMVVVRRVS